MELSSAGWGYGFDDDILRCPRKAVNENLRLGPARSRPESQPCPNELRELSTRCARWIVSLDAAEAFVLRLGEEPRVFDFRRWPFAAQHVGDFARGVGLAVDVRFVRVGRGVA